jgi:hypothetical protein
MPPNPSASGPRGGSLPPPLRLVLGDKQDEQVKPPITTSRSWTINGYPAEVHAWTREQWDALAIRPNDAQEYPNGIRAALRMV